jgi:GxxExxY protein
MELTENEIAKEIVDAAFKIHQRLGPGLLESVYEAILAYELRKRGLEVHRQVAVPVVWDELRSKRDSALTCTSRTRSLLN